MRARAVYGIIGRQPESRARRPMGKEHPRVMTTRRGLLLVTVFISGMTSLSIEMAASRLLAPYFGTSQLIWATLIGLVLIYLSIGYWIGGRIADRWPRESVLYQITTIAGLFTAVVPFISRPILSA